MGKLQRDTTEGLKQGLDTLKSKISDLKKENINEAQTKEWLIKPFFEFLGWDFSDPGEIIPEDDDLAGKRCDYKFLIDKDPKFLLEAKPLNNNLNDNKMILEKLNYCSNTAIPILIITNGDLYRIFYAELKGVGNDKLLEEFSLTGDYDEDLPRKLSKEAFQNNSLLAYARNISLYTNIKKAIEKLFQSSNKPLISSINNIVKSNLGHKFGNDEIDEALKQFRIEINTDIEVPIQHDSEVGKWTVEYQFKEGKWLRPHELYKKMIKELRKKGLDFTENPTKFYISLISGKTSFCQIHGQRSGIKIWLNLDINDISEHDSLYVRDVSNVGHWGMGNVECFVKDEKDFFWLIALIQKAYEKISGS